MKKWNGDAAKLIAPKPRPKFEEEEKTPCLGQLACKEISYIAISVLASTSSACVSSSKFF